MRKFSLSGLRPLGVYLFAAGVFVLLEALIFRTGFYVKYVEPSSSTGSFEATLRDEMKRNPTGKNEVLVIGDSRIGEGFSPLIANSVQGEGSYSFAQCSVPGGTPRCWYYLVRDIDPTRRRYSAIVIAMEYYEDIDRLENMANRTLDLHYVVARLRFSDILDFTSSFENAPERIEAFRGSLFKGFVYQADLLAFMEHRRKRLREVAQWRRHGWEWHNAYKGRSESLSGLKVDWRTRTIQWPANLTPGQRASLQAAILSGPAPQKGKLGEYRRRWLGRIVDLYKDSQTALVFLALPRGPAPSPDAPVPVSTHTMRDLASRRSVYLLPEYEFRSLERPEYYFDHLHLNARGREQFSKMLARAIPKVLGPGHN